MREQGTQELKAKSPAKTREGSVRLVLHLNKEVYDRLQEVAKLYHYDSVQDVAKDALRVTVNSYKYVSDPHHGLFWRDGESFTKITPL